MLDCHTPESALASVSAIIGITPERLSERLAEINYQIWPDDPPTLLWREVVNDDREFEGACWFHLSRVLYPNDFQHRGILPLNDMLDEIWSMLVELAGDSISDTGKREIRSCLTDCGHSAWLYSLKVNDRMHWGPYAMLVRDAAFHADDMMNHDYLGSPEIIEDICDCINRRFGVDLLTRFREASHRCIVKFIAAPQQHLLPTALMYVWAMQHRAGMGLGSNTCFDGAGERVPPERIVSTEIDP